ncbi:MAG: Smr/MutS family protein, partial [Deinococcus sp.]|nr:Smr/MutS family protein [Deinococcus sp.]
QLAKTKEASPGFTREKTDFDTELNLRGQMVEDALLELDHFLDEAVATGAGEVRLLHGKGTGALRNAIRSFLAKDRRVASFSDAVPYQGGHGVTVVTLRV